MFVSTVLAAGLGLSLAYLPSAVRYWRSQTNETRVVPDGGRIGLVTSGQSRVHAADEIASKAGQRAIRSGPRWGLWITCAVVGLFIFGMLNDISLGERIAVAIGAAVLPFVIFLLALAATLWIRKIPLRRAFNWEAWFGARNRVRIRVDPEVWNKFLEILDAVARRDEEAFLTRWGPFMTGSPPFLAKCGTYAMLGLGQVLVNKLGPNPTQLEIQALLAPIDIGPFERLNEGFGQDIALLAAEFVTGAREARGDGEESAIAICGAIIALGLLLEDPTNEMAHRVGSIEFQLNALTHSSRLRRLLR